VPSLASNQSSSDLAGLKTTLAALVEPLVADRGGQLVDVEITGSSNNHKVRVLVHMDSGVTIDVCQSISREFADILDIEDPFPGRFRLEVTSPGLDRPLMTNEDFGRACNRRLKVVLVTGQTLLGRLQNWTEERIELDTAKGCEEIAREDIAKATIEVEF